MDNKKLMVQRIAGFLLGGWMLVMAPTPVRGAMDLPGSDGEEAASAQSVRDLMAWMTRKPESWWPHTVGPGELPAGWAGGNDLRRCPGQVPLWLERFQELLAHLGEETHADFLTQVAFYGGVDTLGLPLGLYLPEVPEVRELSAA